MMSEDSDAYVMKIIISEDSYVSLVVRQCMAQVTAGLGIEQFPTAFGRVADCVCVSSNEMVERRIEGDERPFIGGNRAQHILLVRAPTEGLHELRLIICVAGYSGHSIPDTDRAHLEGVRDRQRRLLFERIDPAVPELRLVVERIQNGWRVALTNAAVDAD